MLICCIYDQSWLKLFCVLNWNHHKMLPTTHSWNKWVNSKLCLTSCLVGGLCERLERLWHLIFLKCITTIPTLISLLYSGLCLLSLSYWPMVIGQTYLIKSVSRHFRGENPSCLHVSFLNHSVIYNIGPFFISHHREQYKGRDICLLITANCELLLYLSPSTIHLHFNSFSLSQHLGCVIKQV